MSLLEVEKIVGHYWDENLNEISYVTKWVGYRWEQNTAEPESHLKHYGLQWSIDEYWNYKNR